MSEATAGCPLGHRCESCGTAVADLRVVIRESSAGAYCLTACEDCAGSSSPFPIGPTTIGRFVTQHEDHVRAAQEHGAGGAR
jgi:hypothetical protein